jgi:UDP-galactopyranose mutase
MQSYVNGELKQWPPTEINDIVAKEQIFGYSKKMWGKTTPPEAVQRITTSQDGFMFLENYQGIPDFRELFSSLTQDTQIVKRDIKDGDLDGKIVLTGAIDEYFHYCFGELPYRGMQAVHYESEIGLTADAVTFPDKKIPFQRLVDYQRLGYKGQWLGVESACNAKHYPVRNVDSSKLYNKYKRLADEKGIKLCGRLATYHYMDMDEVILQAIKTAKGLKCLG